MAPEIGRGVRLTYIMLLLIQRVRAGALPISKTDCPLCPFLHFLHCPHPVPISTPHGAGDRPRRAADLHHAVLLIQPVRAGAAATNRTTTPEKHTPEKQTVPFSSLSPLSENLPEYQTVPSFPPEYQTVPIFPPRIAISTSTVYTATV